MRLELQRDQVPKIHFLEHLLQWLVWLAMLDVAMICPTSSVTYPWGHTTSGSSGMWPELCKDLSMLPQKPFSGISKVILNIYAHHCIALNCSTSPAWHIFWWQQWEWWSNESMTIPPTLPKYVITSTYYYNERSTKAPIICIPWSFCPI